MGTLRLLHGHFNAIKEALYRGTNTHPQSLPKGGKSRKRIYDRELQEFAKKVTEIDEMGEKGEKRQKCAFLIWILYK